MNGTSEAWTAQGKEGREEASGGEIERGREGAWEQGREGNFNGGNIIIHKPTIHKPALALETLVLHMTNSEHV